MASHMERNLGSQKNTWSFEFNILFWCMVSQISMNPFPHTSMSVLWLHSYLLLHETGNCRIGEIHFRCWQWVTFNLIDTCNNLIDVTWIQELPIILIVMGRSGDDEIVSLDCISSGVLDNVLGNKIITDVTDITAVSRTWDLCSVLNMTVRISTVLDWTSRDQPS